ncbi:MAG: sigma-54-dependent Fis family transcriptional regulator [Deltaproteobacteria bacterium]|nr:sigma-54-dependent Fis family transcriptional regulator [Deltaproteobacteria bacterium]MBW2152172.1 sigma-54-dependent Fis family transcriptional regulator [Deltaproteobacteria bacterium]
MDNRIIIVDDEQDFLESARRGLVTAGFRNVVTEINPQKAAEMFRTDHLFDVALIDITMPGLNGLELLEVVKNTSPNTECIMISALNEARTAVECIRKGAYDYQVKPITRDDLVHTIHRALERKRLLDILDVRKKKHLPDLTHKEAFRPIVTRSPTLIRILKEAELHAASTVPVLITGESGTGKELLARAIHLASPRASQPFIAVNMASMSSTLFDAEFFGHTRGAFTGAEKDRAGYLEHTNRGTLFLDEIGTVPAELQGKLLRVLQEGEYTKLGTNQPQKVDIRFIAATNEDLDRLMAKNAFRKDLYYRLKGAWLSLPPLRERTEDIPLLIDIFLRELKGDSPNAIMEEETLSILMNYDYPGNVRELKSIVQSALNLAQNQSISPKFLPSYLLVKKPHKHAASKVHRGAIVPLAQVEKRHILRVYSQLDNNKAKTAKCLGIGLNTLRRKLEQYQVP